MCYNKLGLFLGKLKQRKEDTIMSFATKKKMGLSGRGDWRKAWEEIQNISKNGPVIIVKPGIPLDKKT